jgi:hypothetical protein
MPSSIVSRLRPARPRLPVLRVWPREPARRATLSSRHLWLAVAAGSVALLLIAARRRRRTERVEAMPSRAAPTRVPDDAEASQAAGTATRRDALSGEELALARSKPARLRLPDAASPSRRRAPAADSEAPALRSPAVRFVSRASPCSIELPLPAVQRAALAITLGKPNDLRRLARDLQRAGQDIEAGLLENYALLLERTHADRERLLAEVTRMLRAAAAERRSARRATPAIAWPPTASGGGKVPGQEPSAAMTEGARASGAPDPAAAPAAAPTAAADAARARSPDAAVLRPLLEVGARRRASR